MVWSKYAAIIVKVQFFFSKTLQIFYVYSSVLIPSWGSSHMLTIQVKQLNIS